MPSTGGRKFGRKGAQGPDTIDIMTLMKAFFDEWGLTPWFNVTVALDGNMMIEGIVEGRNDSRQPFSHIVVRVFNPNVDNLLHVMLQVGHALYHRVDRDDAISKLETTV